MGYAVAFTEVLAIHFLVKDAAPLGDTELRFLDGAQPGEARPIANVLAIEGQSVDPQFTVLPLYVGTSLRIIPELIIFERGDLNADDKVDIADPVFTLRFLFLGGPPPRCRDEADFDDDGCLNVTDTVATLQRVFLGGSRTSVPTECGTES